ncbi:hypothetical protein [Fluviicola sp.]|uniref:hypothetical protein n=1 Tax=Fluviicola sp. TaxID=1917219 RepID=UPI0031D6FAB0
MKGYLAILIAVTWIGNVGAQQLTEISSQDFLKEMKPVIEKMNQSNCKLKFKKEIYKDLRTNELISTSTGVVYYGSGNTFRMENEGVTIIQTGDIYVIIDSLESLVQLTEPDKNFSPAMAVGNFNLEALSKFKLSYYKTTAYTTYKVIPDNLSEGTIEYQVDNKSGLIYRFKVSYPPANYFSETIDDETVEEPYAVVTYEPMEKIKNPAKLFDLAPYVVASGDGKYVLSDKLINYELYDARYHPIK